jgi:hypothetical protein
MQSGRRWDGIAIGFKSRYLHLCIHTSTQGVKSSININRRANANALLMLLRPVLRRPRHARTNLPPPFPSSRVLAPHARFYVREMRQKAYSQLLESSSSLTIDSLSAAFGVSNEFVDRFFFFFSFAFSFSSLWPV